LVRTSGVTTTTVWTGFGVLVIVGVILGGTPVAVFDLVVVSEGSGEAVHTVVAVRTVGVYVIVDVSVLVGLGPGVLLEVFVFVAVLAGDDVFVNVDVKVRVAVVIAVIDCIH
jgi:hypothetical protein